MATFFKLLQGIGLGLLLATPLGAQTVEKTEALPAGKIVHGDFSQLLRSHREESMQETIMSLKSQKEKHLDNLPVRVVAIDGGAGTGKTSVARDLATKNHFLLASTGENYRALVVYLLHHKVDHRDEETLAATLGRIRLSSMITNGAVHLAINGFVTSEDKLRSPETTQNVSLYARIPTLRKFLDAYHRTLPLVAQSAGYEGLVIEGRDTTSVVFPNASLRLILEADASVRAVRRAAQGYQDNVSQRDRDDAQQMVRSEGVEVIDTTNLTQNQVVEWIDRKLKEKNHD